MDYRYCCVINAEGFLKDRCVLVLMESQPDGTVENKIQGYALLPGESLVDDKPPATKTNADSEGLIKPKRENSAWVEGATAEEITAWNEAHPGIKLSTVQDTRVAESKTLLAQYLASHPLTYTDGKQYSVTAEKQSLLTGNLAAYSIAVNLGITPNPLLWNTTGEECTNWTYEDLGTLALAIQAYVKPFVSYQQSKELEIKACTTAEDAKAVVIDYDSVKG